MKSVDQSTLLVSILPRLHFIFLSSLYYRAINCWFFLLFLYILIYISYIITKYVLSHLLHEIPSKHRFNFQIISAEVNDNQNSLLQILCFFLVDSAHLSDNTSDENNRRLRKCYKVSYTFVLFEFLCV